MQVIVDGWQAGLRFSAAHFIPSHNKCSRLHGHDYAIMVRIWGDPVDGIVVDYDEVYRYVMSAIAPMDHKLLVPALSDVIGHTCSGGICEISYGNKKLTVPQSDVCICNTESSSSEDLSNMISKDLADKLRKLGNVKGIEIGVQEGPGQGAYSEVILNE
ncbi:MAG: 6-carboxytetrahydropterin synthase [Thermoplasmataceae archaeon]